MRVVEALQLARMIGLPMTEAEIFLESALKKSREFFIAHPEHKISSAEVLEFQKYCQARASGIPLAYLTHHKEFFGLDFYVNERVLIPRPETEMLVEEAIRVIASEGACLPVGRKQSTLLDIGTGSGCIAVALAKHIPKAKIVAVDISEGALEVARKNAEFHGVSSQIEFVQSDLLENVIASPGSESGIVANLPYIGTNEHHLVVKEVFEHEPHSALFAGETGLELYERLFAQIRALRQAQGDKAPKWFIGEMGFLQQEAIGELIQKYFGKVSVMWKNDLAGLMRLFIIYF